MSGPTRRLRIIPERDPGLLSAVVFPTPTLGIGIARDDGTYPMPRFIGSGAWQFRTITLKTFDFGREFGVAAQIERDGAWRRNGVRYRLGAGVALAPEVQGAILLHAIMLLAYWCDDLTRGDRAPVLGPGLGDDEVLEGREARFGVRWERPDEAEGSDAP